MKLRSIPMVMVPLILPLATAVADPVTIEVTNMQPDGGFTFSPPWVALQDGTFDAFDSGSAASPAVEAVAELGDGSGLSAALGASGVSGMVTSPTAPPPIIPGESASLMLDNGDVTVNRYFSFASMLVPSNDFFLGNDNPMAYEVFDAAGNFLGPMTINVYSTDAWDAGTEVNDLTDGPAFIAGQDATMGTTENGVVTPLYGVSGVDSYLSSIVGMDTPIGVLTDPLDRGELVATFNIVPEPGALALLALGATMIVRRRR